VTSILYKLVHSDPIHPDNLEVLGLLPDKWHEVFSRVLAKSPSERYPTAADFVQNLELCLGSWFGALEGETVVLREPVFAPAELTRASSADSDETVVVPPPLPPSPGVESDETILAGPPRMDSLETMTAPIPVVSMSRSRDSKDLDETIAAPAPDIERTLYAGPGIVPQASAAGGDETLVEAPPERPAMTVTIRKPRGLSRLVLAVAVVAALVLVGLGAFLLSRLSTGETPSEPIEVAEPPPLLPSAGSLRVSTQPEGAKVLVNGEEKGASPLLLEALPLGTYRIRIESGGFEAEELEAAITAEAPSASLDVTLKPQAPAAPAAPRPALFRIRSNPPGAQVAIDGRDVGVTPIERIQVDAGSRVVRVLREGYLPWEDTFRARAGRTETIEAELTARAAEPEPVPEPVPTAPEPPRVVEGVLVERGEPGVTNPKCVRCPGVPFPEAAKRSRLQGVVEMSFLIDENGEVSELEVLESGGEVFDDAVIETVRSWRYEPATKHGVRVKMRWVQRFRFQQGR
jgi:TonB family protein